MTTTTAAEFKRGVRSNLKRMFRELGYEAVVDRFLALGLDKSLFQTTKPDSVHILSVKHIRAMVKLIQGEVFTREPTWNFSPAWRRRCEAVVSHYRAQTSPVTAHKASVTELVGYQVEQPPAELPAVPQPSVLPDPMQELEDVLAAADPVVAPNRPVEPDVDLEDVLETLPEPLPPPKRSSVGERRRQCEAIIRHYAMSVIAYRKRLFSTVILDERKLFADAHTLIYNLFGFETGIVADPHGGNQLQWLEENGYLDQFLDFLVHRRFPRSVSEIGQARSQGGVG